MDEITLGTVIEVNAKNQKILKGAVDNLETAHIAFTEASTMLKVGKKRFFDSVFRLYPELRGFELTFIPPGKIMVVGKEEIV